MQEHNRASAWFDDLYKEHSSSHENIPWARLEVNPLLNEYIENNPTKKSKALVIGCGLGDDAIALENTGVEVVAIDVAQTALDLAKKRFPNSKVSFIKQDIFDMPSEYFEHFDFIYEALTIQSLPREFRAKMIKAIAGSLKKGGEMLVVAHQFNGNTKGPPWPLTKEEIDLFLSQGLKEISFELIDETSKISNQKFRVLYTK